MGPGKHVKDIWFGKQEIQTDRECSLFYLLLISWCLAGTVSPFDGVPLVREGEGEGEPVLYLYGKQ